MNLSSDEELEIEEYTLNSSSSSSDEDKIVKVVAGTASILLSICAYRQKKRRNRSVWVNPYLIKRQNKGRFVSDFEDMRAHINIFKENFHITPTDFDALLELLDPLLQPKKNCRPIDAISPKEKLAIVLEYFASGSLQRHMASIYRISKQHFGTIIDEVCNAICEKLNFIENPNEAEFIKYANEFNLIWNFPNCVGAIDGKHVGIKCPKNAGSLFYNYKDFHSIVLMAAANAKYQFIFLDIGAYGSEGDAGVFSASKFGKGILQETLPFPEAMKVGDTKLPFFFVADDAFPLHNRIMKPYAPRKPKVLTDEERIFNYRLSRARRCVENAFGILCAKWICLGRTMFCGPDRAQKIVTACCFLHNYFIANNTSSYCPFNFADSFDDNGKLIPGGWRKDVPENSMYHNNITASGSGRQTDFSKNIRDNLKLYVNSNSGSLSWQRKAVFLD